MKQRNDLWAVVLAAGEGKRLASLTGALYGRKIPKQFAALDGERSLLQTTMQRIAPLVPARRTAIVLAAEHEALGRRQLRRYAGATVLAQPQDLDTGPGVLLPLAWLMARDPEATVAIFPSDHFVADAAPYLAAVRLAAEGAASGAISLLGVEATHPETEYGWILPGSEAGATLPGGLRPIDRFVEKPSAAVAAELARRGGLWNTFVLVGRVADLWSLATRHLPAQAAMLAACADRLGRPGAQATLRSLYERMPPANFSRSVLEAAAGLAVVPVHGSGWSDWGHPVRVFRSLEGTPAWHSLRQRLASSGLGAAGAAA